MKRIDRVNNYLQICSKNISREEIENNYKVGFSAEEIGSYLGIVRNNVASDLNELVRLRNAVKIKGKPVRFISATELKRITGKNIEKYIVNSIQESFDDVISNDKYIIGNINRQFNDDCFSELVGFDRSLKVCVSQAKAAVYYPPHGLNTLILGESGVGKSLFAEKMFEYGKQEKIFNEYSKIVIFNCADYANNPQLLLGEIFGCKKGAYTGAIEDRKGVIEEANNGVLFLDEIHRLPPEGQEMLFFFMDKGKYRRLGESSNERSATVMIIGATTESIESSLLRTFTRRIPVTINMPSLKERSLKERLGLVKTLFSAEAKRIGSEIYVHKQVVSAFLIYSPPGNIGQLRSDIQITVARAFLEQKSNNRERLEIVTDFLPSYVRELNFEVDEELRYKIDKLAVKDYFEYKEQSNIATDIDVPKYDFEKYFNDLRHKINNENMNLKKIYDDFTQAVILDIYSNYKYSNIINEEIIDIVNIISDIVYEELEIIFDKEIYYSLAFHFKNITELNYIEDTILDEEYKQYIKVISSKEFAVAIKIVKKIEREFSIHCSKYEPYLLATIFSIFNSDNSHKFIDVVVIAHGDLIAEKLAETANSLLGINHIKYINMPLSIKPEVVLKEAIKLVNTLKNNNGVLFMVDMGSLVYFQDKIEEETGYKVRAVENLNIVSLIEATRRALIPNASIDEIVYSLMSVQRALYEKQKRRLDERLENNKKVIYTICNTGQGTATYLEKSIKKVLKKNNIYDINVISISVNNRREAEKIIKMAVNEDGKYIVAIVGSIEFTYNNIPYISLQEMLVNTGVKKLLKLIDSKLDIQEDEKEFIEGINKDIVLGAASEVTSKYLQCLSIQKIHPYIVNFIDSIDNSDIFNITTNEMASMYVHLSCMIERIILKGNILKADDDIEAIKKSEGRAFNFIKDSLRNIEEGFSISIPEDEIYYLLLIVKESIKQCTY